MNTRIMAVALVVVSLLGMRAATADEVVLVRVVPFGSQLAGNWAGSGRTVVVLSSNDGTATFPLGCGSLHLFDWGNIEVVVIKSGAPAVRLTIHPRSDFVLAPGTRLASFTSDGLACCTDENAVIVACTSLDALDEIRKFTGNVIQPSSAGSALFSSPVELGSDSIGVVTGQPNDDGTYTVIFKKQGSPAQQVDIATDDVLLAADVLRDLIDLGCDDDTGEHLYLADIEW